MSSKGMSRFVCFAIHSIANSIIPRQIPPERKFKVDKYKDYLGLIGSGYYIKDDLTPEPYSILFSN